MEGVLRVCHCRKSFYVKSICPLPKFAPRVLQRPIHDLIIFNYAAYHGILRFKIDLIQWWGKVQVNAHFNFSYISVRNIAVKYSLVKHLLQCYCNLQHKCNCTCIYSQLHSSWDTHPQMAPQAICFYYHFERVLLLLL